MSYGYINGSSDSKRQGGEGGMKNREGWRADTPNQSAGSDLLQQPTE